MDNWLFPLKKWKLDIPRGDHPGAFGAIRKFDIHTGVDLYCSPGTAVYSVEDGEVIEIEKFTGPDAESPWWHETLAVLIRGSSGVVCYGEVSIGYIPHIENPAYLKIGDQVSQGDLIGWTKQVLKKDKGKPMCMLHLEVYSSETNETVWWKKDESKPENLFDPTEKLLASEKMI